MCVIKPTTCSTWSAICILHYKCLSAPDTNVERHRVKINTGIGSTMSVAKKLFSTHSQPYANTREVVVCSACHMCGDKKW